MIYYPKLLLYFYSGALTIDASEFIDFKRKSAREAKKLHLKSWTSISPDNTINGAVAFLMAEPNNFTEEEATDTAKSLYAASRLSLEKLEESVSLPVMNTPFKVDKKLKWICPLPCVREYLQSNCGVREHWYYKLFWRGKKHFL